MSPTKRTVVSAVAAGTALAVAGAATAWPAAAPRPAAAVAETARSAPPTTAECRVAFNSPCYSVQQLAHAYGVDRAHRAGWTGRGATVVLPMWHSVPEQTLRRDLAKFSAAHGLPPVDLEYRTTGPITTIVNAVQHYAADHPGAIVSMSYGIYESQLSRSALTRLDRRLTRITRATGTTIVAANGDFGNTSGSGSAPDVPWPASSPAALAVGGTEMRLDDQGCRQRPDTVWGDPHGIGRATGGGLSRLPRPRFQDRYARLLGDHRSATDVAANGSGDSRMIFYSTYNALGGKIDRDGDWRRGAGTSVAAPLWAGVLALVRQAADRPLGQINPALYKLAAAGPRSGLADVVEGSNAVPSNPGYAATPGWDRVSGWGTIGDARLLVPALAAASRRANASSH